MTPTARTTYSQLFPAWAAFAILYRLEPSLRMVGVLPFLGWIALVAALLILTMGFLQKDWKRTLNTWLAGSMAVSVAALCFSDPVSALSLMVCSSLAAVTMSLLGVQLEKKGTKNSSDRKKAVWAKTGVFLSAAVAGGMLGFVSATGIIGWLIHLVAEPALLLAVPLVLLFISTLGWRLAWQINAINDSIASPWIFILVPYLLILLPLSLFWVGSLSGGVIPGDVDSIHWLASLGLGEIFGSQLKTAEESALVTASWIHWGTFAISILTAWWTTARKQDLFLPLLAKSPRTTGFIVGGYGTEVLLDRTLSGVLRIGAAFEMIVDQKLRFKALGPTISPQSVFLRDLEVQPAFPRR